MSYYTVHMGRLDRLNPGGSYAFPTAAAAELFARNHKRLAREHARSEPTAEPDRLIMVEAPDGTKTDVPYIHGAIIKIDFATHIRVAYCDQCQWRKCKTNKMSIIDLADEHAVTSGHQTRVN